MKVRVRKRAYIRDHGLHKRAALHARMEYEITVAPACQPRLDNTELERTTRADTHDRFADGHRDLIPRAEPLPSIGPGSGTGV